MRLQELKDEMANVLLREWRTCCHHGVERKWDCVGREVQWPPILSMTYSAQHELANYLYSLLQPVLTLYLSNCILDSFTFADIIKSSKLDPSSVFLCSFDISSLFTNVPLAETIQITADVLYKMDHLSFPFLEKSSSNLWKWRFLNKENQCDVFLERLYSLHPSLRFTMEKNLTPPFPSWMC